MFKGIRRNVPGWMFPQSFPFSKQLDSMDCGPTCVQMIAKFYGKDFSLQSLREKGDVSREGISLTSISDIAEQIGFKTLAVKVNFEKMANSAPLPAIAHWNQNHFIVVHKIGKDKVYVADPSFGLITYSKEEFLRGWVTEVKHGQENGFLLLLDPTPAFHGQADEENTNKASFRFVANYLLAYRKHLFFVCVGLFFGSLLQLLFPFLTQAIIDRGIGDLNLDLVYLILLAQVVLIVSLVSVEYTRAIILVHIGSRINIQIISDFLTKLMKLPVSFFDVKLTGDLTQRIRDHKRIEEFLTGAALNCTFAVFSIVILSSILAVYSLPVFLIFLVCSCAEVAWVLVSLKKRRYLSNKLFSRLTTEQNSLIEIITGMQEIKLNGIEKKKRWQWQKIQAAIFQTNLKIVSLRQYQDGGTRFIGQLQIAVITFISARSVIEGGMTLGAMMAIIYILGQLSTPLFHLIEFIYSAQDAKISLERLGEIHLKQNEETEAAGPDPLPWEADAGLTFDQVTFSYPGQQGSPVLRNVNLHIPGGKVTAIVGSSGSGKTTLLKLLLKFYHPQQGEVRRGYRSLGDLPSAAWRKRCGVVMQDGFIFADTIANNIALEEPVDKALLLKAVTVANIGSFIESLPSGYNTRIGQDGIGLSQGQKQRILIARAVYKDPDYLFFDEATNALDANNELVIMRNLEEFFKGRTVIIVAHRLSTVKNADQIVVLDRGRVIEQGMHEILTARKDAYYTLVKNQLELGN